MDFGRIYTKLEENIDFFEQLKASPSKGMEDMMENLSTQYSVCFIVNQNQNQNLSEFIGQVCEWTLTRNLIPADGVSQVQQYKPTLLTIY